MRPAMMRTDSTGKRVSRVETLAQASLQKRFGPIGRLRARRRWRLQTTCSTPQVLPPNRRKPFVELVTVFLPRLSQRSTGVFTQ